MTPDHVKLFTFHHVSIKTGAFAHGEYAGFTFTFHHVSIKTILINIANCALFHSHSTMYLLKLWILLPRGSLKYPFTFHHVSIKTLLSAKINVRQTYSHSTMYLLKLNASAQCVTNLIGFTFHHVSIKTQCLQILLLSLIDSHSTMYLLKPNTIKKQYFTMLSYPLSVDLASILGIHFLFFNCIFHFSIFHHIVD